MQTPDRPRRASEAQIKPVLRRAPVKSQTAQKVEHKTAKHSLKDAGK